MNRTLSTENEYINYTKLLDDIGPIYDRIMYGIAEMGLSDKLMKSDTIGNDFRLEDILVDDSQNELLDNFFNDLEEESFFSR